MKAIKLNEKMVAKELRHYTNRIEDTMVLELSVEPLFGTTMDEELYRNSAVLSLRIEKESYPEMWKDVKELTNNEFMDYLVNMLNVVLPTVKAYEEEEENPRKREGVQETVDGELVIWYKDEDGTAFEEARTRTAQQPVMIEQPNQYEEQYEEIKNRYPVLAFENGIKHLRKMGVQLVESIRMGE